MQCKIIIFKSRAHDYKKSDLKHGSTVKLMLSRAWLYIAATINRGKPKQVFAQRNPISAITHSTPNLENNRGTALGLHGGRQW